MCGIIGYVGTENASRRLIEGLKILEYRGYDSSGICLLSRGEISIIRAVGRVENLENKVTDKDESFCGIGHTRWATHGSVSEENAHPHRVGRVTLVHNGIIENYLELRARLEGEGYSFKSQTDTEVACALFDKYYVENVHPCVAIYRAVREIRGSYAFGIMFDGYEGRIFGLRHRSPLLVGLGSDGLYLSSDITALLPFTKTYSLIEEAEVVELREKEAIFYTHDGICDPVWQEATLNYDQAQKGGFSHFMLKEINEQSESVRKTIIPRVSGGLPDFSHDGISRDIFQGIKQIHIVGCGSAYNVGCMGARLIEEYSRISASAFVASEYRYSPPANMQSTLVIAISQSGETADTLASVRYAKLCGCRVVSIINARETSLARESDKVIYTYAGPEIAVATTKGFATQLSILYLLSVYLGIFTSKLDTEVAKLKVDELDSSVRLIEGRLKDLGQIEELASLIYRKESCFFIGRSLDYFMCQEGALKLKEISYIHAQAYQAGELKHGTISLIEEGTPVISLMGEVRLLDKTLSNVKETKSRGAFTISLVPKNEKTPQECGDFVITLMGNSLIEYLFDELLCVQMLAYKVAVLRGCDIDKPRNLAKSVTVE